MLTISTGGIWCFSNVIACFHSAFAFQITFLLLFKVNWWSLNAVRIKSQKTIGGTWYFNGIFFVVYLGVWASLPPHLKIWNQKFFSTFWASYMLAQEDDRLPSFRGSYWKISETITSSLILNFIQHQTRNWIAIFAQQPLKESWSALNSNNHKHQQAGKAPG